MLCRLFVTTGAGCGNRTHFVSLKRRVHLHICQSREILVGDAGIEPAWSRLRGECISHFCQSPMLNTKLVQDVGIEPTPRDYRSRARPSSQSCKSRIKMVRRSGVEPASVGCRPTVLVR